MPRKLRKDSLNAELASIETLLQEAIEIADPVGKLQFQYRKDLLLKELKDLEEKLDTLASVAIYFGGKPVIGSRGILADFAGKAIEEFQTLISTVQAFNTLGKLGERGRVPVVANSDLMITEVAKGSFGFILEEVDDQIPLFESSLKNTVDLVSTIIAKTCDPNEEIFEEILPEIDARTLISLKNFFKNMDNHSATLRIIEDDKEFIIDEESAHRGKLRTDSTVIDEDEESVEGTIKGFLPGHRRFEFKKLDGEEIYGAATIDATKQYNTLLKQDHTTFNNPWRINVEVRNIKPLNRPEKKVYRLTEFVEQLKSEKT